MKTLKSDLEALIRGESLSRRRATEIMDELVAGEITPEQASALLLGLRMKGESVDEIVGFAASLRTHARKLPFGDDPASPAIDVAGTGGGTTSTFNVSTTVSFIAAAAGQRVAKHGNRSVSSRSGCFDALEALRVPFSSDPARIRRSLEDFGLGFLFAQDFHPALKNLATLRKSLGVVTVFNALGPLLNPLGVVRQVIGVYDRSLLERLALASAELGAREVMLVHGADGVDEVSICAPTEVVHLQDGKLRFYEVTPESCGLQRARPEDIRGGSPEENAKILLAILGGAKGAPRDLVVINAAAALVVAGRAKDFRSGAKLAAETIDTGAALALLERMRGAP